MDTSWPDTHWRRKKLGLLIFGVLTPIPGGTGRECNSDGIEDKPGTALTHAKEQPLGQKKSTKMPWGIEHPMDREDSLSARLSLPAGTPLLHPEFCRPPDTWQHTQGRSWVFPWQELIAACPLG